jgi:hypothetical protein
VRTLLGELEKLQSEEAKQFIISENCEKHKIFINLRSCVAAKRREKSRRREAFADDG